MDRRMIPYGRQTIGDDDIAAVVEVLKSDWLTTGPKVAEFEQALARKVGAKHAVAVSSGTAALHAAMFALGIGRGDEVIVPVTTFAATANAVLYQGGTPVFADVEPGTLCLDPAWVEKLVTPRTRAIVAVDYAGQPCDYDALRLIARKHGLPLVADACHALGAIYKGKPVGSLADLSTFSFHPVKHVTTGEGGMITTDNAAWAERMRRFRNHGIMTDFHQREELGSWHYEMVDLGCNYRITDFQCALGISQLRKLDDFIARRREVARRYDQALRGLRGFEPLAVRPHVAHAYHLYPVLLDLELLSATREGVFRALRDRGIGVNVHYIPVPWHPYYQRLGYGRGRWPVAESAYERLLSLPIFPGLRDEDVDRVIHACSEISRTSGRWSS